MSLRPKKTRWDGRWLVGIFSVSDERLLKFAKCGCRAFSKRHNMVFDHRKEAVIYAEGMREALRLYAPRHAKRLDVLPCPSNPNVTDTEIEAAEGKTGASTGRSAIVSEILRAYA